MELTSALGHFTPRGVAIACAAAAVLLAPAAARVAPGGSVLERPALPRWLVLASAGILLATFVTAAVAPPNTWDALVYHHPRLLHWLDQGSVAPYETSIDREIRMPVLATYMRAPLYVLTGSDLLFNIPQWTFFAAAVAESAWLAYHLAGTTAAAGAALFMLTLPSALLQSSGSGNDLITGGYVLSAALVLYTSRVGASPAAAWLLGSAVGLAAATKGTGYVFAAVLLLATALGGRGRPWRARISVVATVIATTIALNAPHVARTTFTLGSPLPHPEMVARAAWTSGGWHLPAARVVAQLARASFLQLDLVTRASPLREGAWTALLELHERIGVRWNDPPTTFWPDAAYIPTNEDTAGNTLHFATAALASIGWLARGRRARADPWRGLLVTAWIAWIALTISVRWMPWNARLQLPALMLFAAPVGAIVGTWSFRRVVFAMWLVGAAPYIIWNATRPLVPFASIPSIFARSGWENVYRARPDQRFEVERVIAQLPSSCSDGRPVGLRLAGNDWEYPFWLRARQVGRDFRFRHVAAGDPLTYCAVISSECVGRSFCLANAGDALLPRTP